MNYHSKNRDGMYILLWLLMVVTVANYMFGLTLRIIGPGPSGREIPLVAERQTIPPLYSHPIDRFSFTEKGKQP